MATATLPEIDDRPSERMSARLQAMTQQLKREFAELVHRAVSAEGLTTDERDRVDELLFNSAIPADERADKFWRDCTTAAVKHIESAAEAKRAKPQIAPARKAFEAAVAKVEALTKELETAEKARHDAEREVARLSKHAAFTDQYSRELAGLIERLQPRPYQRLTA